MRVNPQDRPIACRRALALAVLAAAALASTSSAPAAAQDDRRAVEVRYTEYGIPHIRARTWTGLGFGNGYAQARDNVCALADAYVTVRGERSRYFGAEGTYVNGGTPFAQVTNLSSDFFFRQVIASRTVQQALRLRYPRGPRREARALVRGYVAGYNRYLAETGVDRLPDRRCRGAEWVRPITMMDAWLRLYQVSVLGGSLLAIEGIGSAQPPGAGAASTAAATPPLANAPAFDAPVASNALALGARATRNGHGMLLGNPHFPWTGVQRFWQSQMTIPGRVDVMGATLLGTPLVAIGHNANVAWSHTVSTARRFGLYQLTLAPGDPTSYIVDGRPEAMTPRRITVPVRRDGGGTTNVTRTLYSTRWGPVTTAVASLPVPLTWTATSAYAFRDVNAGQLRLANTWFEFAYARGVRQLLAAGQRTQGIPFVNTIAADKRGLALYADTSVVPHVTDDRAARCNTALGRLAFGAAGVPVFDGSRAECDWGRDRGAIQPGTFAPRRLPYLFRRDYVENSNDSPWLANLRQRITGYPRIVGDVGTARRLRTRIALLQTEERLGRSRFTLRALTDWVFGNRVYAGELVAADAVRMCRAFPGGQAPSSAGPVDVGDACDALAGWDRRADLDSRGAVLFFRFWEKAAVASPSPWRVPFDEGRPVATPNTLDTDNPAVQRALGDAIRELRAAGLALDAPLRAGQYVRRRGDRIPLPGGPESAGVLNKLQADWDADSGFSDVSYGTSSSYIQFVAFNDSRCPDTRTILTYGQSTNPRSPHSSDQTRLFSRERLVRERFCEREIQASPVLRTIRLRAPRG